MYAAILTTLAANARTAETLNTGLWTGRFASPATRELAERALANCNDRIGRLTRVLWSRYGTDLRFARAAELTAFCQTAG